MNPKQRTNPSVLASLQEVAETFRVRPYTLHRLCRSGLLPCESGAEGWFVRPQDVEDFVKARVSIERPTLTLVLQGKAPNGYHESGVGWAFHAVSGDGNRIAFQIWFSDELIVLLRGDNYDANEAVRRGASACVADTLLVDDELTEAVELLYGAPDRGFILFAATNGE